MTSNRSKEWREELGKKFADRKVANSDGYVNVDLIDFIESLLSQQRAEIVEKVEGMNQITMIPPSRFGDGKPTQIPDSDYCKGYNQAIDDVLQLLKGEK